jgi:hypothetical protein
MLSRTRLCWFVMGIAGKMWVRCRFSVSMSSRHVPHGRPRASLSSESEAFSWFRGTSWAKTGRAGDTRDDGIVEDDA